MILSTQIREFLESTGLKYYHINLEQCTFCNAQSIIDVMPDRILIKKFNQSSGEFNVVVSVRSFVEKMEIEQWRSALQLAGLPVELKQQVHPIFKNILNQFFKHAAI